MSRIRTWMVGLAVVGTVGAIAGCGDANVSPSPQGSPVGTGPAVTASPAPPLSRPSTNPSPSLALALALGTWSATAPMSEARTDDQTATLLPDGTVLVVGGSGSAEVFDPRTGAWRGAGRTSERRGGHTATLLMNGTVLAAGGNATALASADLYDPASRSWSPTGHMHVARQGHGAARLADGKVLVVGGQDAKGKALASAELYDPATKQWALTSSLREARTAFTTTLLQDGSVLIAGGGTEPGVGFFASAEVFDPAHGTWTAVAPMNEGRRYAVAAPLPNGMVLIAGGIGSSHGGERTTSAELYDPATHSWTPTNSMIRARGQGSGTRLSNGNVLVMGGEDAHTGTAEVYDAVARTWTQTGPMTAWRASAGATLLGDGRVLVTGGYGLEDATAESAELYDPTSTALVRPPGPYEYLCEIGCQGQASPGVFTASGFNPHLQLAFENDRWFNTADYAQELQFDQLPDSDNQFRIWVDPRASTEQGEADQTVGQSAEALTAWFAGNRDMVVSTPETFALANGSSATTFTLRISDTNVNVDPGCPPDVRSCLNVLWIADGHVFAIGYGEAVRLYLFTIGTGPAARTIVASLDAPNDGLLAHLTVDAAPIIRSVRLP